MDRTAEKSNARLRQKLALVLPVASIAAVALLLPKLNEKLAAWLGEQFVSRDTCANPRHLQKTLAADGSALRSVEISYSEDGGASSAKILAYLVENEVADEPLAREIARKVLTGLFREEESHRGRADSRFRCRWRVEAGRTALRVQRR